MTDRSHAALLDIMIRHQLDVGTGPADLIEMVQHLLPGATTAQAMDCIRAVILSRVPGQRTVEIAGPMIRDLHQEHYDPPPLSPMPSVSICTDPRSRGG